MRHGVYGPYTLGMTRYAEMIEALGISRQESAEALARVGVGGERRIMRALELAPRRHPNPEVAGVYAKALFMVVAQTGSVPVARLAAHNAATEKADADYHGRPAEWVSAATRTVARHGR